MEERDKTHVIPVDEMLASLSCCINQFWEWHIKENDLDQKIDIIK